MKEKIKGAEHKFCLEKIGKSMKIYILKHVPKLYSKMIATINSWNVKAEHRYLLGISSKECFGMYFLNTRPLYNRIYYFHMYYMAQNCKFRIFHKGF